MLLHKADGSGLVARLVGQAERVQSIAFSPDGKAVASAGFDGVVRLNDPTTGKLLKEFVPVPGLTTTTTAK